MTSSKHDYSNYDRFAPNFDMANKIIKHVSVPNLKSFGPTKTKWENRLGMFSCLPTWLPQYRCMEIFNILNSRNFYIHWYMDLKLTEIFQNGVI